MKFSSVLLGFSPCLSPVLCEVVLFRVKLRALSENWRLFLSQPQILFSWFTNFLHWFSALHSGIVDGVFINTTKDEYVNFPNYSKMADSFTGRWETVRDQISVPVQVLKKLGECHDQYTLYRSYLNQRCTHSRRQELDQIASMQGSLRITLDTLYIFKIQLKTFLYSNAITSATYDQAGPVCFICQ